MTTDYMQINKETWVKYLVHPFAISPSLTDIKPACFLLFWIKIILEVYYSYRR